MTSESVSMAERWAAMKKRRASRETKLFSPDVEALAQSVENWEGEVVSPPGTEPLSSQETMSWADFINGMIELAKTAQSISIQKRIFKDLATAKITVAGDPVTIVLQLIGSGKNQSGCVIHITSENLIREKQIHSALC